jgi:glutamine---fructose-6-phosphate transaminase (isomerizing)
MAFDPTRPLPDAPDPWASSSMPERRSAPPYVMTEMIAAEPELAERLTRRLNSDPAVARLATLIRESATATVVITGCGTSEHAAMVIASLLRAGMRSSGTVSPRVTAMQALELAWEPMEAALVIGVSHEGGTWATNLALERARSAGARTGLVTVSERSPGAAHANVVIATHEQDQSWCHTVGYLSPILAGAALAARLFGTDGIDLDPIAVRAVLESPDDDASAEAAAAALAACRRVILAGSGIDHAAARELALKIEEGSHLPAVAYQLETVRHGHLAAAGEQTGLVMILTDGEAVGDERPARVATVLRSARVLGMPAVGLLAADLGDDLPAQLTPGGRLAVPTSGHLSRLTSAALGVVIPLQLLAERLARARGVNPDTIGRDDPRQAAAADA